MTPDGTPKPPPRNHFLRVSRSFFNRNSASHADEHGTDTDKDRGRPTTKWSMGVLNVTGTHEVPGSVILLSDHRNHPLGLRHAPAVTSSSSLPPQPHTIISRRTSRQEAIQEPRKKTTADGVLILDPQPEDVANDPLNWPKWRRDCALLSLGFYCMLGGGMTPILAAGFGNVAETYNVSIPQVALTTGLYMMGLGVGSVFASPTAILYGKRPVYLFCALLFVGTSCWCAVSPSYMSLLVARIFQGVSVSSVECLPSATIAEIFFLHERAYRIGIYTLLLLGGKNLVPLVSAAIIQSYGWRWVFWIVAIIVGFCGILLFVFVPESFWDRTPHPHHHRRSSKNISKLSFRSDKKLSRPATVSSLHRAAHQGKDLEVIMRTDTSEPQCPPLLSMRTVGFVQDQSRSTDLEKHVDGPALDLNDPETPSRTLRARAVSNGLDTRIDLSDTVITPSRRPSVAYHDHQDRIIPTGGVPPTPALHNIDSPYYAGLVGQDTDYIKTEPTERSHIPQHTFHTLEDDEKSLSGIVPHSHSWRYTNDMRQRPALSFVQQLKPYRGRLSNDRWIRVAIRPFILFAYPAVLWSALVYACAVGWLIVLSESVSEIYRKSTTYNFSALSTGLIYISPFIGGVLGTAVAGKVSDIVVRSMTKRNGGLYEPEFRLVMGVPITIATVAGLMGYGWSAQEHDAWIVPTIFFGIISFGCSLASTTSITFCVDSYRQYAGEALVTLNFSKNIFHGLVFSLFFNRWLEADGSRRVFIWLGVIQLFLMAFTIPMYIFGKRARMWTVKMNLMETF